MSEIVKLIMKILILIISFLASLPAFSKTVDLALNARVSHCSKNISCELKDSTHKISIELAPLADTGLDYGIGDLTFKSPSQKFGFKVIASSLKNEEQAEIVFLVMDENYRINTFTLVMNIPETLNGRLRLNSPVFTDSKGASSSLGIEVVNVETKN